jgi:hypothetical protein
MKVGVDFIRKTARSFHKGLDKRRIELATPGLFTQQPVPAPRTYAAKLSSGEKLKPGEKLGVRLDGEQVLAVRGLDQVATFTSPSAELVQALSATHGEAAGVVQQIHDIARVAEISVC